MMQENPKAIEAMQYHAEQASARMAHCEADKGNDTGQFINSAIEAAGHALTAIALALAYREVG